MPPVSWGPLEKAEQLCPTRPSHTRKNQGGPWAEKFFSALPWAPLLFPSIALEKFPLISHAALRDVVTFDGRVMWVACAS